MAHARQIMYAARPQILAEIHPDKATKGLKAHYFTQTLVPDYMTEHPEETADWDVVFDERGHFRGRTRMAVNASSGSALSPCANTWHHGPPASSRTSD